MGYTEPIAEYERIGYSVDQIGDKCAVIHKDGVDRGYTLFDNTVATLAYNHDCFFLCQSDMKEMHEKTVGKNKSVENYDIYRGVFEEDAQKLQESEYEFE